MTKKTKKKTPQKRKRGRPTKYSIALSDRIIKMLADGMSIKRLTQREDMPKIQAFYDWKARYPDFSKRVKRAREISWEARLDSCIDTIDRGETDQGYSPNRITAVVNARINLAKAMFPEKYSDKQRLELSGDKDKPVAINLNLNGLDAKED